MIKITGSTQRSFIFPADLPTTFEFFSDISRILHYLPYISIARVYSDRHFRMLYRSKELGIYRVNIYCDFAAELDPVEHSIHIQPLQDGIIPVKAKASLYSLVSSGFYSSSSILKPSGVGTRVDYQLELTSDLPVPLGVKFMPAGMVNKLANEIVERRMQEIIEGFISRSIRAYQLLSMESIRWTR